MVPEVAVTVTNDSEGLSPSTEVEALEYELRHVQLELERQRRALDDLQHKYDNEVHRNEGLRAELVKLEGQRPDAKDRLLEPVGNLVDTVKGVEQARTLLAELSARIAESLEEREALLMYVLEKAPDAPEKQERERVEQTGDTGHSFITRLRIGKREKLRYCDKCGQPSKEYCSAHLFVGFFSDGRPGELFIKLDRRLANGIAGGGYHVASRMVSLALQHGCKAETIVRQLRHQKDSSAGRPWGADGPRKDISNVSSLSDYIGMAFERIADEWAQRHAAEAQVVQPPQEEANSKPAAMEGQKAGDGS